jgi:CheY-like chemotaxis protein
MDRPRLLVVDDDPYTRVALNAFFGRGGWQVALAATVAEALARLDPAPHCLILDLDLPDGDGEQVLREVRQRHPETRVVVCSGVEDPSRVALVRSLGPEMLLWKPVEPAPLYRLCQGARAASA